MHAVLAAIWAACKCPDGTRMPSRRCTPHYARLFNNLLLNLQEARRQLRAVLAALWAVPLADVEARDANAKPALHAGGDELIMGRAHLRRTPPDSSVPQKASAWQTC